MACHKLKTYMYAFKVEYINLRPFITFEMFQSDFLCDYKWKCMGFFNIYKMGDCNAQMTHTQSIFELNMILEAL